MKALLKWKLTLGSGRDVQWVHLVMYQNSETSQTDSKRVS